MNLVNNRISTQSQSFSHKILVTMKKIVVKSGRYHLNQMIKHQQSWYISTPMPPGMVDCKGHSIPAEEFLTKIRTPDPIIRKHQTNLNWGAVHFKNARVRKYEVRLKRTFQVKGDYTENHVRDWKVFPVAVVFVCFLYRELPIQFERSICVFEELSLTVSFLILMITLD